MKILLKIVCFIFIKSINKHIKVRFNKYNTCYSLTEDKIYLNVLDTDDCGFIRHLCEKHFCDYANDYDILIWAMLHEIGHCETQYFVENDDAGYRDLLNSINHELFQQNEALQNMYYDLPLEKEASEWAISYEYEHQDKIIFYDKIINKLKRKIK